MGSQIEIYRAEYSNMNYDFRDLLFSRLQEFVTQDRKKEKVLVRSVSPSKINVTPGETIEVRREDIRRCLVITERSRSLGKVTHLPVLVLNRRPLSDGYPRPRQYILCNRLFREATYGRWVTSSI